MFLSELITDLWYNLAGLRVPRVTAELFAPMFVNLLNNMLPYDEILGLAGIDYEIEVETSLINEYTAKIEKIIEAHVTHLERFQPAHNSIQIVKVERICQRLHGKAMMASRAYGETLVSFLQLERLSLSSQYNSKVSNKIEKDGNQWNALTAKYTRGLLDELAHIKVQEPQTYKLLVPSGKTPKGIENIANYGTLLFNTDYF